MKVYADVAGRIAKGGEVLKPDDFVGQADVRSGWPTGYGRKTVVDGAAIRKK